VGPLTCVSGVLPGGIGYVCGAAAHISTSVARHLGQGVSAPSLGSHS
jgi:hypothetical protein